MPKILFITWDGPQTTYMEGLFMPIFAAVQRLRPEYVFHVLQFTWANEEKNQLVVSKAKELGIYYSSIKVKRKPLASIGAIFTLLRGIGQVRDYLRKHHIEVVMPRTNMPGMMVNRIKRDNFSLLYDADGLQIEERVDFGGLKRRGILYNYLSKEENKMLLSADHVITRSKASIAHHLERIGRNNIAKFSVVTNGRDINQFQFSSTDREFIRKQLGLEEDEKLFVYCGSLGPQYGWNEMVEIITRYKKKTTIFKWLILTGSPDFVTNNLPSHLMNIVILKKVPFAKIPCYLSAADFAFALRKPTYSMRGVAPIKLGEYLLMGLPTIASAGIGDTENILPQIPHTHLFDHDDENAIDKAVSFLSESMSVDAEKIREAAVSYFSLENSALRYIAALESIKE